MTVNGKRGHLGAKLPGAYRYKTFEDLMCKEYETALEDVKITGFS